MPFQRGAPKGNRNRFVHGLYSKAVMARKEAIRKRRQIVRLVIQRVNIVCRLHDALERKNTRLLEARPVRYTKPLCTVIRKRGKLPRFRDLAMCIGSKCRHYLRRREPPLEPAFKLIMYWASHCKRQDWDTAKVYQLIWACGIDPDSLLAK